MCQEEWEVLEVGLPGREDLGKGRVCLGNRVRKNDTD